MYMNSLYISLKNLYKRKNIIINYISKKKKESIFIKIIIIVFININILLFLYKTLICYEKINLGYKKSKFAILRRINCLICGLFSDYIIYLGCIHKFMQLGYVPIIDLPTFKDPFTIHQLNKSFDNLWEKYFYQPYNYTLNDVKQKGKNIFFFKCEPDFYPNESVFYNSTLRYFWHSIANKYIPLKNEIMVESNNIFKKLFKDSNNILGILMRGTDYIVLKLPFHPIPPKPKLVIKDIKLLYRKNKYEWFFLATEDDRIREIFIKQFGEKLKYFIYNKKINYNYKSKNVLSDNKNIKGNINFIKIYLLNIIILSKCMDIICAQTSGSLGAFIMNNNYRFSKVYNLGYYK